MERLRIDKWLWAARFYKTRSLASDEIDRGRVQVNGVVVKASRELKAGDTVRLRNGEIQRTLLVQAISDRRGGAPEAALLYTETAESVQARLALAEQRRLAPEPARSLEGGRPTKRERRDGEQARGWGDRWSASMDGNQQTTNTGKPNSR